MLLLALFYWIIDVKGYKKWAFFFIVIGMNPIFIYFLQHFLDFSEFSKFFVIGIAKYAGSADVVVYAIAALAVKWLLLFFLYRHKIFFKV